MASIKKDLTSKLDKELASIIEHSAFKKHFVSSLTNLTYSNLFLDKMLIIQVIREGVPYSFFNLIQDYTPFSENDWAKFLDISTKSLQRYKQTSKIFKPTQSEKIMEMAEVTNVGLDVFGEMDKFRLWLDTPNFSLGNMKPIELLNDSYGKEMVIGELTRINYGILV
jgi:putative toxin-antitoxin system antitoxin component (TIGR02293 family)